MTDAERKQQVGEIVLELTALRERRERLNLRAKALAVMLKSAAGRLHERSQGTPIPADEHAADVAYPDANEANTVYRGIAQAQVEIEKAERRLEALGVSMK